MTAGQELQIQIRLLGPFEISCRDHVIHADDWPRKKASLLLKRLALERRLLKDQVIEFLWPESDPLSAANNLYKTLHSLRQVLNSALDPRASQAIYSFEDGVLSLQPSVWVDVAEFERLCAVKSGKPAEGRVSELTQALALYRGDLLPDERYLDWASIPRQRLVHCWRETCLTLADSLRDTREFDRAISLLIPLLEHDQTDEPVHRELMRLYAMTGQQHKALRQYQSCVSALAAEIDALPSPETDALHHQILNQDILPPPDPDQPPLSIPALPPEDQPRPLFVGRERELSILGSHLKAALAGDGGLVFITGEAGQGKTSLMAEFTRRILPDHPQLVIACGACQDLIGVADPYLPFRDLFAMLNGDWQRPWLDGHIPPALVQRLLAIAPQTAQAITAHAPGLLDILIPKTGQGVLRPTQTGNLDQQQLFYRMGEFLRALSAQQPLLLLIDDLQWIDSASASLLFYLGRQLVNRSILIVCAYRPSALARKDRIVHPLSPVVQELVRYRGDIQIDLDSSSPIEERGFIDAVLDSEPNGLDTTFREALYRRTKGQPLFTVELLRALQDQGDLARNESGMWSAASDLDWAILPARVEAVIAQRIEALPHELRQLLAVAGVEGESFTVEVLAQVGAVPVRTTLQTLTQDLDHRFRLVRESGEWRLAGQSLTRFQFRHNLFQQYLYHQLGSAERRSLHREIAETLVKIGGDQAHELAVILAHHFMAAGDPQKALPYLCRAGDDARRRVALEEAVRFYESALDFWQDDNPGTQAEILHNLGETQLALGNSPQAIQCFSKAEKLYARAGNRSGMGAMQRLIGRSYFEQGERAKALNHYHKVLALLEHDPQNTELARAISAISQMHMSANQYDEAISWGDRALSLARAADMEDVILHALTTMGTSLANKGEAGRGLPMLAESQERAVALNLPHDAGRAYAGWGDALVTLERYEEAQAIYNRMLTYARKVHTAMFEGVALVQLGYLDWWAGRWRQAWARRQEILDWMAIFPGASFAKVWASNFLGLVYNDVGQPQKAGEILAEYSAVARSANEPQTTVPHLGQLARCAQSQAQEAGLVQEILSLTDSAAYPPYEVMPALTIACRWLAQRSAGDMTTLARLDKVHSQMQNQQSAASLNEVRAFTAGIRGEWGQAARYYKVAAANWEALQRPYDLLRTLAAMGRALISGADATSARAAHQQAALLVKKLASELDDPEVKGSFMASPLVIEIQSGQPA